MTTITLTIPDELAEKAKERDLLSSSAIASYLEEKLAGDAHGYSGRPPWKLLTEEEIQRMHAEMDACRAKTKPVDGMSIVDMIREERDMS